MKGLIFKIVSCIPSKWLFWVIKLLAYSKAYKSKPIEALRFLFDIEREIYSLEGFCATRYDGGIHAKHRLMNYHDFFIKNIETGNRVLDIGCGNGALASDIADNVRDVYVTGVDIEKENIQKALREFSRVNIEYVVGDATKDLPDDKYDVIIMSNVLEHIENRVELLKLLKEKYQPQKLLIRVPMFDRDWRVPLKKEVGVDYRLDDTHFIEYTFKVFKQEIEQSGMNIQTYKINWGEIWAVIK